MSKRVERFFDLVIIAVSLFYATINLFTTISLFSEHNFGYDFLMGIIGTLIGYICCIVFTNEV